MPYVFAVAAIFACAGAALYGTLAYNGLVAMQNETDKAWSNIDVLLKQRHDELSSLVETCKGYMQHEREVLQAITAARALLGGASTLPQIARADQAARAAAHGLFAVAENYPSLKADTTFQWLQKRITELEAQIADRREFYNETVKNYNTRLQTIPDAFVAAALRFRPREFFNLEDAARLKNFAGSNR